MTTDRNTVLEYLNTYLQECEIIWKDELEKGKYENHKGSIKQAREHLKEIREVRKYVKENLK